ncbi:reverse transcriptase (RNA-dependent DNA polymerase) domain-containing protein [Phthorimaea operculella]|nr:reverse transcriptase (RNA-dependent DNA polymerase) domain-containing protein [Phthorimaea operculella]
MEVWSHLAEIMKLGMCVAYMCKLQEKKEGWTPASPYPLLCPKFQLSLFFSKRLKIGEICQDLSQAFGFVLHNILLQKLEALGIRGLPLKWLRSYLIDREQCVVVSKIDKNKKEHELDINNCLDLLLTTDPDRCSVSVVEIQVIRNSEANIKLNNFKLAASYCRPNGSRGGTCILVNKLFSCKSLHIASELAVDNYFECCGVEITGLNLIIVNIYRIPKQVKAHVGVFLHKLDKLLHSLTCRFKRKKIIVCGDWNINLLIESDAKNQLLRVLKTYASNIKSAQSEVLDLGLSDHETAQILSIAVKKQIAFSFWFEQKRDYSQENLNKYCKCISALSFSDVMASEETSTAFHHFYDLLCLFHDLCFPEIKVKINNRPRALKWLTRGLKISLKTKRSLYFQYRNCKNTLFLRPVTETEVYNIIMSLKNSKACGYDNITTKILKMCSLQICYPLAHIINLSFLEGTFPDELKVSIVKPLFKKGDSLDPTNYRPITLVPILSKVFEKALQVRLNEILTKYGILQPEQYGFRKGSSTTHACFELIRTISSNINCSMPTAATFLDMSKAFDFVDHSILKEKLSRYGIRGKTLDWIESFLADRKQCTEITKLTKINKVLHRVAYRSNFKINNTGVPQGSVLGPLLFLLYVNDLPRATEQTCVQFADDTTLIVKCNNNQQLEPNLNSALTDKVSWMERNNLKINVNKTKLMQFLSYNASPLQIDVNFKGQKVEEVDNIIFLGITIDKHLSWKDQIEAVCNRLSRFVFALKRLRDTVSVEAAITAYHGYVSSVLSYGLMLWGNSVNVERAFILQKKCIRVLCNAWFDDSCKPLFKKLEILPLPCMYIRDVCVFVNAHPSYWRKRSEVFQQQRRQKYMNLLYQPTCRKVKKVTNVKTALTTYHAYVESVLRYGLVIWGNSTDIGVAFKAQKSVYTLEVTAGTNYGSKTPFLKANIS